MTVSDSQMQVAAPAAQDEIDEAYSFRLVLRLSTFQIGSAMGDILVTSVWNRIMISNFGIPAWPVGLLIALRYLLSPLSLWAGHRSDTKPLFGLHRTPYIWIGRFMMFISYPLLGFSLGLLSQDKADPVGWTFTALCFLLFGVGTLISGSPFLTLVRDSVPKAKQGLAISVVETALIAFFPIAAITFGYWLETYEQSVFWQIVLFTMLVSGFFWLFAIAGVEKRSTEPDRQTIQEERTDFLQTFAQILRDRRTRRFFVFLAIGTVAAWAQDNILEPFGADVFDLGVGQTTRFNAYWQAATVIVLVVVAFALRKRRPEGLTGLARVGLIIMAVGMFLLGLSAAGEQFRLVQLGLIIFGAGFGLYTFSALSLMAVMTTDAAAGAYLGLWTVCILVSRGLGITLGSILRDNFLTLAASPGLAYAAIFILSAIGLAVASLILSQRDILGFARDAGRLEGDELPLLTTDL